MKRSDTTAPTAANFRVRIWDLPGSWTAGASHEENG
jgi:hypothetical protein